MPMCTIDLPIRVRPTLHFDNKLKSLEFADPAYSAPWKKLFRMKAVIALNNRETCRIWFTSADIPEKLHVGAIGLRSRHATAGGSDDAKTDPVQLSRQSID
jgi:hypothetical protein